MIMTYLVTEHAEQLAVSGHLDPAVCLPAAGGDGRGHPVLPQVSHQPRHPGLEAGRGQQRPELSVHLPGQSHISIQRKMEKILSSITIM